MRRFFGLVLALAIGLQFGIVQGQAQTTSCCFSGQGFCVSGLQSAECDLTYSPGTAGANYYAGQSCAQVSRCSATGRCAKTDGSACTDNQKWQCDDLYTQGYRFFQGQTCAAPATSTGTCCVQNPTAGGTVAFCEENIDPQTCSGQRQGQFYSQSCYLIGNCPQALQNAPGQTTTDTAPKKIVFDPEIDIPFFSGEDVDGTTFAKYIRAIFIGFIWSVGVVAVVMVIFGGVKWVAAAGNPARINQAKDVMYNAIIGLVIALTSVVLLSLLNPKLVNFEGLTGTDQLEVEPIPYETDYALGKFNEGTSCKTKNGNSVQAESVCLVGESHMAWPLSGVAHTINSRVGPRNPKGVGSTCHPGTDFYTEKTTNHPIVAPHDGEIKNVTSNVCGEYSMELHSLNFYTRYIHVKIPTRTIGEKVTKGQLIGYSGGDPKDGAAIKACSGGPHLHVELYSQLGELHDIVPCLQQ